MIKYLALIAGIVIIVILFTPYTIIVDVPPHIIQLNEPYCTNIYTCVDKTIIRLAHQEKYSLIEWLLFYEEVEPYIRPGCEGIEPPYEEQPRCARYLGNFN